MSDLIDRQKAIDALWKALHDYEDKAEKRFLKSDALDVGDWIKHRIFVQNMNDIDRRVILDLPSAQPEKLSCDGCKFCGQFEFQFPCKVCIRREKDYYAKLD